MALKLPRIGLGTWKMTDSKETERFIFNALRLGYRHIDTAFIYNNERSIGRAIKMWEKLDANNSRKDLFVTTKLPPYGNRSTEVERYLEESLRRLQLDYVDLYLVHHPFALQSFGFDNMKSLEWDPGDLISHESLWRAMEKQVAYKKARYIGVSNFNRAQLEVIMNNSNIKPAALQVELHPYMQQQNLRMFCRWFGITLIAYSPFGSYGNLVSQEFPSPLEDPSVNRIATELDKPPAQVILSYLLNLGVNVIPKPSNYCQLVENYHAGSIELSLSQMKSLRKIDKDTEGRIFDFKFWKGVTDHPMYPFPDVIAKMVKAEAQKKENFEGARFNKYQERHDM